ncbi:MAG: hypothetical protein ACE5GH_06185 [Fidelibacterota bacterium]
MNRFPLARVFLLGAVLISIAWPQPAAKPSRAFAVGSKFRIEKAADYETFSQWVDSLVAECASHFAADKPNLVVFGELFGMITPLFGDNMAQAREAETLEEAFTVGGEVFLNRFLYHKLSNLWLGISDERALFLSFTNEFYTPFFDLFPRLARKYGCYLIAGTLSARVKRGSPSFTAWLLGYRGVGCSPVDNNVYNIAAF